jgi:50S ribosomal protein L16 3-hydroxylase
VGLWAILSAQRKGAYRVLAVDRISSRLEKKPVYAVLKSAMSSSLICEGCMSVLQELLGPVPVREFFQRHFSRLPFAMPDRAGYYTTYFTDADFAAMVEHARSILRIVRDGRLVQDNARMSWTEAQTYHRRGHTLLVRHAERSCAKVQVLAEEFAHFFHSPVDIQVYLTPDKSQAFGWHYDLEEVFIIQVKGCKEYTIRQNTVNPLPVWDNMPADMRYDRETSRLRMTCRVEAGDWLYIPSGWWHIARTQAESIHLSIGIMPVARLKLFEFLTQHLAHSPFWCQRLALIQGREAGEAGCPILKEDDKKIWEDMRAQLHTLLAQEQTLHDFLAYLTEEKKR